MSYRLHCDRCDKHITRGERYLEYYLRDKNSAPVVSEKLCVEDALTIGPQITNRFFQGSWVQLDAKWEEAF